MCGIAGSIDSKRQDPLGATRLMTGALRHRGPDDLGTWSTDLRRGGERTVAIGQARLAVLDLSQRGHQPMLRGDLALVHNGEIYNFARLRSELEKHGERFGTETDTEVILAGFRLWGPAAIERLEGMFAFALWNGADDSLLLARDRLGIKPLYYHPTAHGLLFASELGALRAHPRFEARIDRRALGRFLRFGYVSAPETIYENTYKLLPGETLTWREGTWRTATYWDLGEPPAPPRDYAAAVEELDALLRQSVRDRLISDVPLGAFLSGGIDSTAVVAQMQELSPEPVKTFSIGFEQAEFDESAQARAVARHLGTEHTELIVDREAARRVVAELPALYDEPFGDVSALPTLLVSRLARQTVTVALTGDGGDELFGGYSRYRRIAQLARLYAAPPAVRRLVAATGSLPRSPGWRRIASRLHAPSLARAAEGYTERITAADAERLCGAGAGDPRERYLEAFERAHRGLPAIRRAMLADIATYLPDDILTKVDRASMSVGLEARVPLLDHRLVRFAAGLPPAWLYRREGTKGPLRTLAYRRVPSSLLARPKQGFGFPVEDLLRPELARWRQHYLAPERLAADGNFDPDAVTALEPVLAAPGRTSGKALWYLLCFQRWFAHHHGASPAEAEACD